MVDLPSLLRPGDVVVVNDTRVLAARLDLRKSTGGSAEVLLLEPAVLDPTRPEPAVVDPATQGLAIQGPSIDRRSTGQPATDQPVIWEALVRPGRRLPPGTMLYEPGGQAVVEVGETTSGHDDGRRLVRLVDPTVVERAGSMPLPPYIHQPLSDPERYQTVFSAQLDPGDRSTAAPTAGLHFTPELLEACRQAGATVVTVDLAIGLDTFRPVTAPTPEEHVIHTERYSVPASTMEACRQANRVVAIGTTAVRALESAAATGQLSGRTDLYIHGQYAFRLVDVLVTNFHLPRSSLLLLVEAFCGDEWRDLYRTALAEGYRFLSFGDAMVVSRFGAKGEPVPVTD
jgi:S-adenosylmethionine:tRNA ribosyltransferase-isomerase